MQQCVTLKGGPKAPTVHTDSQVIQQSYLLQCYFDSVWVDRDRAEQHGLTLKAILGRMHTMHLSYCI